MPENHSNELLYKVALTMLPGVGTINARKLLTHVGGVEALFKEKKSNLLKIPRIGDYIASSLANIDSHFERAEQEIAFIEKNKVRTFFFMDEDYPFRLQQCTDCPIMLYSLGNADLDSKYILSIVGTRKATDYGKEMCRTLVKGLSELGVLVVSGLAYGIDTAAHKNAMDAGLPTLGVLAHGLDRVYPTMNTQLAHKMQDNGGLITEFMSGTDPDRENFPMRNRIIAGLSDATIVVEAGSKGGALITANIANSYDRDVFAVPGRVSDSYSEGCNTLIKTNRAALVQKPEDIIYIMGWDIEKGGKAPVQQKLFVQLEPDQETIVSILQQYGSCSMDKLCFESKLQTSNLAVGLLKLEFEGIVKSLPGKMYQLI